MSEKVKHWITAFRLRTLPLALSSICMGSFLAASRGSFSWGIMLLTVSTTIFLQILSNLANDYGDSQNGADHDEREGPSRAVQAGVISPKAMKTGILVFILLSLFSGISLLYLSFGLNLKVFLFFLGLGVLSIIAAITYTMGKKPYGYAGLGDISVLIFFGVVGVLGSFYLQSGMPDLQLLLPALSCGLFSVGVLNLNNVRDIESDKMAGKRSLPVRMGEKSAKMYHWFLLLAGLVCTLLYAFWNFSNPIQWIFLLSFPLFFLNGIKLQRAKNSQEIDPLLKQLALSTLLFVILFGTSTIL